ncbi:putative FtsJ-like methyltransferase [Tupanvirus soda lake]|uniref:FtsJ-like methyltransferase n=2 Tax=Tupanvirus TaxID=2094720 RepID=A0AC62ABC2_9VIRU|nr:putative FtsJ-like methyltransferase [Tupanvirus soda lake]QKU34999.1 putative FtsJ-like methyltransferase [Tupanvirus soda lake]
MTDYNKFAKEKTESYPNTVLLENNILRDKEIDEIIGKSLDIIGNSNIAKIMIHNKYEKMVPFNLWFRHPLYKVTNSYENNQHMRIRYYNSMMLTPLVAYNNTNLEQFKSFLSYLSLYQPFYPETFYAIWEFLQMKHLNPNASEFLNISREERLGSMEALIFYHEKYQQTYQYNTYHSWLVGKEMYDKMDGSYNLISPKINYLEQAYKIKFLRSTNDLAKYDFINIDCIHLFNGIFDWKEQEMDLQALLFYLLTSLHYLKQNGSMLIRLNIICSRSWSLIFDIVHNFFKEHTFIRPSILNPFNSEIYLFLNKYENKNSLDSLHNIYFKNLYKNRTYRKFYINTEGAIENPVYQNFNTAKKAWIGDLQNVISIFASPKQFNLDIITQWHASNDLKQIKDLTNTFDDKSVQLVFKTSAKKYTLKPILPDVLYNLPFYKKLIEKRAELNYYKRVMDTKPSRIFARSRYHEKNAYFLTWENLANEIDVYRNLKNILVRQYNAEMVSNAWIKMYEILNMFADLVPSTQTVKTFHLCEAPGAFIAATNHLLSNRNQKLDWYAQTLKPTNIGSVTDAALEDRYGLIASYPDRWLFGDKKIDDSGNITHSVVIQYYASNPLLKNIDFMTADAGLQCDPTELNEQEAFLGKINMGQIICILACLPIGKSAIFKTFLPMSEPLTISMIYLVTHLFENVTIVKPSTSHSTNSEVYIVLQKYKGIDKNILEILYSMLDDVKITSKTLLFPKIDADFFKSYMGIVGQLIDRQISSLSRNYYYYYNIDQTTKLISTVEKCTNEWLCLNPIFTLKNPLLMSDD